MWKTVSLIIISLFLLSSFEISAQAVIYEDQEIKDFVSRYRNFNIAQETVEGWRIQIVATTERRNMDQSRARFKSNFRSKRYQELYKQPYYILTTGASLEKLSILPLLYEVKRVFPSAFVVRDKEIRKEELF